MQSPITTTSATSSTPTLLSSRQPCHSAVTVPGRSASHTAKSIATAAIANQMMTRSVVMGSARRAQKVDGIGGELIEAALGGEMGLGLGEPRRRRLVGRGRQRLHQLRRLADVAG